MDLVCAAISIYLLLVFIRIILSWVTMFNPPAPGSAYAQVNDFFQMVTEPVLGPLRAMLPDVRMGAASLDLSPIVVFIAAILIQRALGC